MIVADTNLISYLLVTGERTPEALKALQKDPMWAVPYLWRSEFCNVLSGYVRKKRLTWQDAQNNLEHALHLLNGNEYSVHPNRILELAVGSTCTTYDCEFVALAQYLGVKLVTLDKQILTQFPETALALGEFTSN